MHWMNKETGETSKDVDCCMKRKNNKEKYDHEIDA